MRDPPEANKAFGGVQSLWRNPKLPLCREGGTPLWTAAHPSGGVLSLWRHVIRLEETKYYLAGGILGFAKELPNGCVCGHLDKKNSCEES